MPNQGLVGDAQPSGMSNYLPIGASSLVFQQPAAVLTTNSTGPVSGGHPIIDGYQTVIGDVVLLTGQTTSSQNGLWWLGFNKWQRSIGFTTNSVIRGMMCEVMQGTTYQGSIWVLCTPTAGIIVDTSAQIWLNATGSGSAANSDADYLYLHQFYR